MSALGQKQTVVAKYTYSRYELQTDATA